MTINVPDDEFDRILNYYLQREKNRAEKMNTWTALQRYTKAQREAIDRMASEFSQALNTFEAAAIAENSDLRQQLATAQERVARLEAGLRRIEETLPVYHSSHFGNGGFVCNYCYGAGHSIKAVLHAPDCPTAIAKTLLTDT